jgi:hypothetical protein
LFVVENAGQDRVHVGKPANTNTIPLATTQIVVPRQSQNHGHANNHRPNPIVHVKKTEHVERATSPVDERILNEFYADLPKDMHQYTLEGRQYVVFEGKNTSDIVTYRTGKSEKKHFFKKKQFFFNNRINRSNVNSRTPRSS